MKDSTKTFLAYAIFVAVMVALNIILPWYITVKIQFDFIALGVFTTILYFWNDKDYFDNVGYFIVIMISAYTALMLTIPNVRSDPNATVIKKYDPVGIVRTNHNIVLIGNSVTVSSSNIDAYKSNNPKICKAMNYTYYHTRMCDTWFLCL